MDDLLTTTEAAEHLGITPLRVRQLIAAGRLPARKAGRDWIIAREAVEYLPERRPGWPKGRKRGPRTQGPAHSGAGQHDEGTGS